MHDRIEHSVTLVLAVAAISMAAVLLHREFVAPATPTSYLPEAPAPELVTEWQDVLAAGIPLGGRGGEIVLVEFADFECPYCRLFDSVVRAFQSARPGALSRRLVHFPIRGHRFAIPAARAAECADDQDRLAAMHELLFLGLFRVSSG